MPFASRPARWLEGSLGSVWGRKSRSWRGKKRRAGLLQRTVVERDGGVFLSRVYRGFFPFNQVRDTFSSLVWISTQIEEDLLLHKNACLPS